MRRLPAILALTLGIGLWPAASWSEKAPPPSNAPSPAETDPLPTTTDPNPASKPGSGTAAPAPEQAPLPRGAGTPPAAPAKPAPQTLVPEPADADNVDEVSLPAKPAAILSGETGRDEVASSLIASFRRIDEALAKAGIAPAGRPLAVFVNIEGDVFQYEAMVPVAAAPAQPPPGAEGLRFGTTPSGKALRFRHTGSYDDIGATYETFVAYLEAKDIEVEDRFIEEYVTDLKPGPDEQAQINIYGLVK